MPGFEVHQPASSAEVTMNEGRSNPTYALVECLGTIVSFNLTFYIKGLSAQNTV